ncbi:MAG TPA: hypothetical protein VL359_08865 [bacterium]|nr:hypothetical protein [bacterium]
MVIPHWLAWRRPGSAPAAPRERVGLWLGLLLLFVPIAYPLLFLKRYSFIARVGWGLWLGLIVFVKVFGFSEPVINVQTGRQGPHIVQETGADLPLGDYLGKLLGAQYMQRYRVEGRTVVIVYRRLDPYFDDPEVVADLAISNGYSLMYRRDYAGVKLNMWRLAQPVQVPLTPESFRAFFGLSAAQMAAYSDPKLLSQSPIANVTRADKLRFVQEFARPSDWPAHEPLEPQAPGRR